MVFDIPLIGIIASSKFTFDRSLYSCHPYLSTIKGSGLLIRLYASLSTLAPLRSSFEARLRVLVLFRFATFLRVTTASHVQDRRIRRHRRQNQRCFPQEGIQADGQAWCWCFRTGLWLFFSAQCIANLTDFLFRSTKRKTSNATTNCAL